MKTCRVNRISTTLRYNILSVDGGGIRGLVVAVSCCELERITQRPCSSMFHMMAGTSTGAIIIAGLSVPNIQNSLVPEYTYCW